MGDIEIVREPDVPRTDADLVAYCAYLAEMNGGCVPSFDDAEVDDISGNINHVRRVRDATSIRSIVVKALPEGGRLQRYPEISFPEDRLVYERHYYDAATRAAALEPALANWVPGLLHVNRADTVLVLEDLAPAPTLEDKVLAGHRVSSEDLAGLGRVVGLFHRRAAELDLPDALRENPSTFANLPYVLTLPFADPAMLQGMWRQRGDATARIAVQEPFLAERGAALLEHAEWMLERFRSDAPVTLVHGDLHATSLFARDDGTFTAIDCELCMWGAAWFDPGTLLAHLVMLSRVVGRSLDCGAFLEAYLEAAAFAERAELRHGTIELAGFEIIRRIIGAANMHYIEKRNDREDLLALAAGWIINPADAMLPA